MSSIEPKGPYIYQPFGSISHPSHAKEGRLWGIGGLSICTTINGLTREEAKQILTVIKELKEALDL